MNKALQLAGEEMNVILSEFTVAGVPYNNFFAHHWFIASDDIVNTEELKNKIDNALKEINDDYAVERKSALKEIIVEVLPLHVFMDFMAKRGKIGGQHKFPRVLKGKILEDWQQFVLEKKTAQQPS
jgi:hypothetical protein